MNKDRRKAIDDAIAKMEEAKELLETARDEEQEYYDNMPETFQNGNKGDEAQAAVSSLEEAIDQIDSAISNAEGAKE